MIENRRSARRMAGFSSRPPIMQAGHLPGPWPILRPRRRIDADVAAEMRAEVGRLRMLPQTPADAGPQAVEQRLRLLCRTMRILARRQAADELEQQLGCDHGGSCAVGSGDTDKIATSS